MNKLHSQSPTQRGCISSPLFSHASDKRRPMWMALLIAGLSFLCGQLSAQEWLKEDFKRAGEHLSAQLNTVTDSTLFPRTIRNGQLALTRRNDWTEGFYPGCLWYMYEYTGENRWKEAATRWTEALEPFKTLTNHHDIGFLMYCSFGNAYRLTQEKRYKDILVEAARSLCTRFNPKTGCIESWNYRKAWNGKDEWFFPVIIDNMMNLELLYFATKVTGDTIFSHIANTHATTTARNHFRDDYSSYHVVNYDEDTGQVLHRATCQGFADNSTWARGQAWAIYGFTMAYRETGRKDFLETAIQAANFWLSHPNLPNDGIPYWDFNAGQNGYVPDWNYDPMQYPVTPRDASAAAIAASAFLELSNYAEFGKKYREAATHILKSLSSPKYLAEQGTNGNFILMHSVGSIPHGNEIDVPLVYADYYFLEALLRYQNK